MYIGSWIYAYFVGFIDILCVCVCVWRGTTLSEQFLIQIEKSLKNRGKIRYPNHNMIWVNIRGIVEDYC
jgi:hypothetical protein